MKKLIFGLTILALASAIFIPKESVRSEYMGQFGQYFSPEDTVRIPFNVHDTTGLDAIAWDSGFVYRTYRGAKIDSIDQASSQISSFGGFTGHYEVKMKADPEVDYDITDEDSIGVYNVTIGAYVKGKLGLKTWSYQVLRGNGLNALYDLRWFLGGADNGYRVLYPVGGYPKDSVQYYAIVDQDGDGAVENGDTLFVSTVYFYHSNISRVLDSSKTIFHRNDL